MSQLKKQPIFDTSAPNKSTRIINGECSGVLNWNDIRIPEMYKLYKVLIGNHWIPEEISMMVDAKQFPLLTDKEQHAFLRIIGLLGVLDSMQTMYVGDVKDYLTDSSLQAIAAIIGQQEAIHNQSYTYVLSSIVSKDVQDEVFEYWKHDEVLRRRNEFISEIYQNFRDEPTPQSFFESLVADIILEGLFFYSGFAFFYNLARDQKMLATSKMISYIQRDENQHVHYFATMFKQLLADYPELDTKENKAYVYKTFDRAVQLETDWAYHLLDGIKGLDLEDLSDYIKFKANQRLSQMGLEKPYEGVDNCLPWIRPFSDEALNATNTDFFEGKPRTYAKVTSDFDDL